MLIDALNRYQTFTRKIIEPMATQIAGHSVQRLLGFWVLWHMMGGSSRGVQLVGIGERQIQRTKREFLVAFGCDVSEFLPELAAEIVKAVSDGDEPKSPR